MFDPKVFGADKESSEAAGARFLLTSKIRIGELEQQKLLEHCAANIPRDRYVRPAGMQFLYKSDVDRHLVIKYEGFDKPATIHPNALGQIADIAGIARTYVQRLHSTESWREELLAYNLNVLFKEQRFLNRIKAPSEFLHRLVGNELRGFLTQSYNRHLLSMPLLQAFLEACAEVGAAPVSAHTSDTRVGLQCYLPWVFEPVKGEFLALGVWWGNSDFGDGKLRISHTIMRVRGKGSVIMEDSYSRVHLGSVVQESDLRLSDQVAAKEIDTVASAIKDAVKQVLSPDSVRDLLSVIEKAHAEEIPWEKLKGQLGKLKALSKEQVSRLGEMLEKNVTELPRPGMDANGNPLASRWWAAAAVALIAEHETDSDRQSDLKQAAGRILGV